MVRTAQSYVDLIAGRAIISAETIASELRRRIVTRLAQSHGWKTLNATQLLALARSVLMEFEPTITQALYDSEIAAWVTGMSAVAAKLPTWALDELALASGLLGRGPGTPYRPGAILWPGRQPAFIRFPGHDNRAVPAAILKSQVRFQT